MLGCRGTCILRAKKIGWLKERTAMGVETLICVPIKDLLMGRKDDHFSEGGDDCLT